MEFSAFFRRAEKKHFFSLERSVPCIRKTLTGATPEKLKIPLIGAVEMSNFITIVGHFAKLLKNQLILVLLAGGISIAHAENRFVADLTYLKEHGVTHFGGQPIDELIKKGREVPLHFSETVEHVENDGSIRRSGEWDAYAVSLSAEHFPKFKENSLNGMIDHEFCQKITLGSCDENFRNSALLGALKFHERFQKNHPESQLKELSPSLFNRDFKKSGGVTGVDGGGDARIYE